VRLNGEAGTDVAEKGTQAVGAGSVENGSMDGIKEDGGEYEAKKSSNENDNGCRSSISKRTNSFSILVGGVVVGVEKVTIQYRKNGE